MARKPGPEEREGRRRQANRQHRVSGKFAVRPEVERRRLIETVEQALSYFSETQERWWWLCAQGADLAALFEQAGLAPAYPPPPARQPRESKHVHFQEPDSTREKVMGRQERPSSRRTARVRHQQLYEEMRLSEVREPSTDTSDKSLSDDALSAARAWHATPISAAQARLRERLDADLATDPARPGLRYL